MLSFRLFHRVLALDAFRPDLIRLYPVSTQVFSLLDGIHGMETHAVIPVDASTATKQIPGLERVVVPKHDGFVDVDGPALMVVPAEIPPRHVPTSWTTSFNPQEQNQRFAEAFISPRPKERVHAGEFLMAIWRGESCVPGSLV